MLLCIRPAKRGQHCKYGVTLLRCFSWIWEIEHWIRKDLISFLLLWEVSLLHLIGPATPGDVAAANAMECWYIAIIMIPWLNAVNSPPQWLQFNKAECRATIQLWNRTMELCRHESTASQAFTKAGTSSYNLPLQIQELRLHSEKVHILIPP